MLKIIVFSLVTLLMECGLGGISHDNRIKKVGDELLSLQAEEYAIYSVLMDEVYAGGGSTSIAVQAETSTYVLPYTSLDDALRNIDERLPGRITKELFDDFKGKNKNPSVLQNHFNSKIEHVVISKEEMGSVFSKEAGWNEFFKRYPGKALVVFSRVGFNSELSQALVYTSSESGGKSGRGYYVFLGKDNGSWVVIQKLDYWVS
jgi:hypothetical protein